MNRLKINAAILPAATKDGPGKHKEKPVEIHGL